MEEEEEKKKKVKSVKDEQRKCTEIVSLQTDTQGFLNFCSIHKQNLPTKDPNILSEPKIKQK